MTISMMSIQDNKFIAPGWMASLAVHSLAAALAMMVAAQVKPALREEVFKWEVALTQAAAPAPQVARPQPVEKPAQPTPRVVPPRPVEPQTTDMVMTPVAPQHSVQMVHPVVEPVKPVVQNIEVPQPKPEPVEQKVVEVEKPKIEPVQENVVVAEQPKVEPIEQKVVEVQKPKVEPVQEKSIVAEQPKVEPVVREVIEAKASTPAVTAEPIVPPSQPVAMAAPVESADESRPVRHEPVMPAAPPAPPQTVSHEVSAPPAIQEPAEAPKAAAAATAVAPPALPSAVEAPVQVAKATAPGPEVKADHRWLAESLWRRVAELKRYPSSARLNGQEGKVILKAVIRSDGHLAEVSVQKSSGHTVLDMAAIEAVKLACPLHMKHELGKPQIVVSLPIIYSLAN